MLITKTNGKKSHSLTMAWVSFIIVCLWLVLSIFEKVAGINIRAFDPMVSTAFLVPMLANYFGGKWLDSQRKVEEDK